MKIKDRAAGKYAKKFEILKTPFIGSEKCKKDFIAGVEWAKAQFQWMQEHNKDLNAFDCMSLGEEAE